MRGEDLMAVAFHKLKSGADVRRETPEAVSISFAVPSDGHSGGTAEIDTASGVSRRTLHNLQLVECDGHQVLPAHRSKLPSPRKVVGRGRGWGRNERCNAHRGEG